MSKSTKKSSCLKKNSASSEQKLNTGVGGSVKSFVNNRIQKIPNSMHNSKQKRRSLKRLNFGSSPENKKTRATLHSGEITFEHLRRTYRFGKY